MELCETDYFGSLIFKDKYGFVHRGYDKPAIIKKDGSLYWYANGHLHRDNDKPAVVTPYSCEWYQHGIPHRDNDQPAIIINKCIYIWIIHGRMMRQRDLPPMIYVGNDNDKNAIPIMYEPTINMEPC